MFQSESKPLHCLEKVANVFLILTSLVFVGLGVFLCVEVKTLYAFEGILIIFGICCLVLVFLFQCSKSPANILNCYLYGLSGLVVFQTIISIMALVFQNRLVEWILKDHLFTDQNQKEYEANIRHKIHIFVWIGFTATLIQVICLGITIFFRASVQRRRVTTTRETLLSESLYNQSKDAYPDEEFEDGEERRLAQLRNKLKKEYPSRNTSLLKYDV